MNAQTDSSMPTNDANENVVAAAAEGAIPPDAEVTDADPNEIRVLHDPENPRIEKGALFPDITAFRKAVRHYAVKTSFEFAPGIKTDPTRFIARCKHPGCPWRIHASRIHDEKTIHVHYCINSVWMCILITVLVNADYFEITIVQIKVLPAAHNCPTTKLVEGKMASQSWVADRLTDWLKKNPSKGPKAAKEKVEGDYGIKLKYSKAYSGMQLALQQIHCRVREEGEGNSQPPKQKKKTSGSSRQRRRKRLLLRRS